MTRVYVCCAGIYIYTRVLIYIHTRVSTRALNQPRTGIGIQLRKK